jgi:hypothetical protein
MALQVTLTNDTTPFYIAGGPALFRDNETMVTTVAGPDIVKYTVLAQDPSTEKWTPLIDIAATDGTSWPRGVYLGDTILAATIQAGDVTDIPVLVGGNVEVDEAKLVFEAGTVTLASELGPVDAAGVQKMTVRRALEEIDIYPVPTQNDYQIAPVVP